MRRPNRDTPATPQDAIAKELAEALSGLFTVSGYRKLRKFNANYRTVFCKPTKNVATALSLDREVLAIIANFSEIQARTISVAKEIIAANSPRLSPDVIVVVHADKRGDEKLRHWGREESLTVIPIHRPSGGALPTSGTMKQRLSAELFASDPFQITGPVSDDTDFFGRKNEALELLRQLRRGRILALFGLRKTGKTSLVNRVIRAARDSGTLSVAMVDCSHKRFYSMRGRTALRALAKACKMASSRGYAHVLDAMRHNDAELAPVFADLWTRESPRPLAIVLDEIDHITPDSTVAAHWAQDFNEFWREFRAVVQEAQRHDVPIGVLVSGVSSRCFRMERIGTEENAVLHFIPEEYLAPFERRASSSMMRTLGHRCGLHFDGAALQEIASTCGDTPFWMRMAGSQVHRSFDIDSRPVSVGRETVQVSLRAFLATEGAEIGRVALQNLRRVYPEQFETLERCAAGDDIAPTEGRILVRYGLARQEGERILVSCEFVNSALAALREYDELLARDVEEHSRPGPSVEERRALDLDVGEWAEELAVINRRRNILERRIREYIRFTLKAHVAGRESWVARALASVPKHRREELAGYSADAMMSQLYWLELKQLVSANWHCFERALGDKKRFGGVMDLLNDRPDAHAKEVDSADLALYRRELTWLEERILA